MFRVVIYSESASTQIVTRRTIRSAGDACHCALTTISNCWTITQHCIDSIRGHETKVLLCLALINYLYALLTYPKLAT